MTNFCLICETTLSSKRTAEHHLISAMKNSLCKANQNYFTYDLIPPKSLTCKVCSQPFSSFEDLNLHLLLEHLQPLETHEIINPDHPDATLRSETFRAKCERRGWRRSTGQEATRSEDGRSSASSSNQAHEGAHRGRQAENEIDEEENMFSIWTSDEKLTFPCPFSGMIEEVNGEVEINPELVNESPYDLGWIMIITPHELDMENLLDADEYVEYLAEL